MSTTTHTISKRCCNGRTLKYDFGMTIRKDCADPVRFAECRGMRDRQGAVGGDRELLCVVEP